ncbi:MAG: hypothetical protein ACYTGH_21150, partial [Planctomycetota bacterium]
MLRIREAKDLSALAEFDEPFWVATTAPAEPYRLDPVLLERLSEKEKKRLTSERIREAWGWVNLRLTDFSGFSTGSDSLALNAIRRDTPEGEALALTAERVLTNLDVSGAANCTLTQVRDRKGIYAQGTSNGDGIIPPTAIEDEVLRGIAEDVIKATDGVEDVGGEVGVGASSIADFRSVVEATRAWQAESDVAPENLFPLVEKTEEAWNLLEQCRPRIEEFYELCELHLCTTRLGGAAPVVCPAPPPEATCDGEARSAYLQAAPLAAPNQRVVLSLLEGVNPAYEADLLRLGEHVVRPILGNRWEGTELARSDWQEVMEAFASYRDWQGRKLQGNLSRLSWERIEEILAGDGLDRLQALIDDDAALAPELVALDDLEALILLQRDFFEICNHFISFSGLYHEQALPRIGAGVLILGGRVFRLNLRVSDYKAHAKAVKRSGIFVMYLEITGPGVEKPYTVATPVTDGAARGMVVGRCGTFYDREGRELLARTVMTVENPVSLRQATWAPFASLGNFFTTTLEKFTQSTSKQLESSVGKNISGLEKGVQSGMTAK